MIYNFHRLQNFINHHLEGLQRILESNQSETTNRRAQTGIEIFQEINALISYAESKEYLTNFNPNEKFTPDWFIQDILLKKETCIGYACTLEEMAALMALLVKVKETKGEIAAATALPDLVLPEYIDADKLKAKTGRVTIDWIESYNLRETLSLPATRYTHRQLTKFILSVFPEAEETINDPDTAPAEAPVQGATEPNISPDALKFLQANTRTCKHCKKEYYNGNAKIVFCSSNCRLKHFRQHKITSPSMLPALTPSALL